MPSAGVDNTQRRKWDKDEYAARAAERCCCANCRASRSNAPVWAMRGLPLVEFPHASCSSSLGAAAALARSDRTVALWGARARLSPPKPRSRLVHLRYAHLSTHATRH